MVYKTYNADFINIYEYKGKDAMDNKEKIIVLLNSK